LDIVTKNKIDKMQKLGTKVTAQNVYDLTLESLQQLGLMTKVKELQKAA